MSEESVDDVLKRALQEAYDKGYRQGVTNIKTELHQQLSAYVEAIVVGDDPRLNQPIEYLHLTERPRHPLRRAGINTIGQLITKTDSDLLALANFGQKSLDEVEERLAAIGLKLANQ